jgi:hypothetical protein
VRVAHVTLPIHTTVLVQVRSAAQVPCKMREMREPWMRSATQMLQATVALLLVVNLMLVTYWMQGSPRTSRQHQSTVAGTGQVQQVWGDASPG